MKRLSLTAARLIIATAALAFGAAHAVVLYRVTDLGPGSAGSLNNVGQVLGSTPFGQRYVFTPGSGAAFLPQGFFGAALNDAGLVAGSYHGTSQNRAALFDPARGLIDLGTFPGGDTTLAYGINNAGQVVGEANNDIGQLRAFRWSAATGLVDLGALGGAAILPSTGLAINGAGQVTGYSARADFSRHAFIHTPASGLVDIDTLASVRSLGWAINDAGHVTGEVILAETSAQHAFLYKPETDMVALVSPGVAASVGYGINAQDHIVGHMLRSLSGGEGLAFLYDGGPSFIDLNTLLEPASGAGWTLDVALDINDFGQIVGNGRRDGVAHGFLLTPVPEPSTWALMLGGLALLGAAVPHRPRASLLSFNTLLMAGMRLMGWLVERRNAAMPVVAMHGGASQTRSSLGLQAPRPN
jgi:probable HAF family extracellular repeat protein